MKNPDRREFVISITAAMAGLAMSNAQSQNPGANAAVLGQGKYQWKVVPNWGVLDADTPVKDCHAMVQVSDGRIFLLTNHTKNNVIIYDKAGKLLGKWGTEYPGAHGFTLARENGEEVFYLTDHSLHQVFKLSLDGKVLRKWDYPEASGKYTKADEYKPTHVALAPDGGFFVVDGYGKSWVHRYDAKGEYVKSFGGNEPGGKSLACAHGAWVDTRDSKNLLWVTSRSEGKLKRFTMDGDLVDLIDLPGTKPNFIVPFGEFTMIPYLNGNQGAKEKIQSGFVSILGADLKVIANLAAPAPEYVGGKLQPMGSDTKLLTNPHGILIDDEESVYIAQWNSGNTYPIKLQRVKA
jgi:peptidylamidoglycolate lyase